MYSSRKITSNLQGDSWKILTECNGSYFNRSVSAILPNKRLKCARYTTVSREYAISPTPCLVLLTK